MQFCSSKVSFRLILNQLFYSHSLLFFDDDECDKAMMDSNHEMSERNCTKTLHLLLIELNIFVYDLMKKT